MNTASKGNNWSLKPFATYSSCDFEQGVSHSVPLVAMYALGTFWARRRAMRINIHTAFRAELPYGDWE